MASLLTLHPVSRPATLALPGLQRGWRFHHHGTDHTVRPVDVFPMDPASPAHSRHSMSKLSHEPWRMSAYLAIFLEPSKHEREGLLLSLCLFLVSEMGM